MSQEFATYNADRVILVFAGQRIQGFADGTFVRIRRMTPGFSSKAGSDGLVSRSRSNDPRHEVAFILEQTSQSNDVLSAIYQADLAAPNGAGVAALSIEDLEGRFSVHAEFAWVAKDPDAEFARETGQREWALECVLPPGARIDGGN